LAGCRRRQESPRGDQNLRAAGREGELSGASGALSIAKAVLQPFHIVTPAKAGVHASANAIAEKWAPAFRRGDELERVLRASA